MIAGAFDLTLDPLVDDQELDARTSVGTIYWEAPCAHCALTPPQGDGYLELTGYGAPLLLRSASSSVVSALRRRQRENQTT